MPKLTPEQLARQQIDAQLVACGWVVQDYNHFNPSAGRGIALREAPLKSGTCNYLLLVDRKAVGVTEANQQGTFLSGVAEQNMCIPLSPPAEQRRIVTEAERRLSVVEELEAVVPANLQRATRLRQSILSRAFQGKS
jgi:hypothetical protein